MVSNNQINLLQRLGWDARFEHDFQFQKTPASIPGRISSDNRHFYRVITTKAEIPARLSGRLRQQAEDNGSYPAVGDWVALELSPDGQGIIQSVLPRRSQFSRQASGGRGRRGGGRTVEQVAAANIDTVFIVGALDEGRSTNARRFERYLTLVWSGGAQPVVVLNKSDLCDDIDSYVQKISAAVSGVPVHAVSAMQKKGLEVLRSYTGPGKTVALLGPSGVGKSALVNALVGEEIQATGEVRERDRTGRHTTSSRELILIPKGGVVIDTPGMREIHIWAGEDDLSQSFTDIQELAESCRFKNCSHSSEPGCAIRAAIAGGALEEVRLESYEKLQRELQYQAARQGGNERRLEKERWKKISIFQKNRYE